MSADEVQVSGNHYKDMPIQPWALMEAVLTPEEFQGFLKGNIIKYAMRQGKKAGSDDEWSEESLQHEWLVSEGLDGNLGISIWLQEGREWARLGKSTP